MAMINSSKSEIVKLTKEQKTILKMSELDIKKGKLISQEVMDKKNTELLNAIQKGIDSDIVHDIDKKTS